MSGLEVCRRLKARHIRHQDVEDDQVGIGVVSGPQGGGSAVGLFHSITGGNEFDLHDDAICSYVIDDQDSPCHAVLTCLRLYLW